MKTIRRKVANFLNDLASAIVTAKYDPRFVTVHVTVPAVPAVK